MPFGWGESEQAYQQAQDPNQDFGNESSFGHEALAGAASFGAFKVFEDHQRSEGKPVSHQFAKELLVGFAGAEVDKLAETKGMDFVDREEAKRKASDNVSNMYDQQYGNQDQYDPTQQDQHQSLNNY